MTTGAADRAAAEGWAPALQAAALDGRRRRLPLVLQAEAAECGLACLCMITGFHGMQLDLPGLRRRVAVSLRGTTLHALIAIAESLQLQGRALKLELRQLPQLQLPCILHWDMNHFVVLRRCTRDGIVIHDPAVGERRVDLAECSAHFTGVALELRPAADFSERDLRSPLRLGTLLKQVHGLRRAWVQVILLALMLELLALAVPLQMQWIVDQALPAADRDLVLWLGCGFAFVVLLQGAITALRGWLIAVASTQWHFQWLVQLFAHLLRLPMAYFEKRHLGAIQSCFGSVDRIQQTLTAAFVKSLIDGVLVLGTLGMMLAYDARLAAVSMAAAALYAALRLGGAGALRAAWSERLVFEARQHTHFIETVRGMQAIRLFGREPLRRQGWSNLLADQFNASLRVERIGVVQHTASALVFGLEHVVAVWLAALAVLDARLSLGMVFAFFAYKEQFSLRAAALVDHWLEFRTLQVHLDRLADIVHAEPEDTADDPAGPRPAGDGSIELKGVRFRYGELEPEVLRGVDLRIEAGESVAITGPSGCGKTTLVKILLGLLEPTAGELHVGGTPLRPADLRHYRSTVGTVMQDDHLYTGSIADNICFFDPAADPEHIENCARQASLHDEVLAMPMGYETLIGDIGSTLSGGQRQRVLLARALYRRPTLLVLDEATSQLDVANERSINDTIRSLKLTRIIVAHRPETIRSADRVVVLAAGATAG